MIIDLKFLINLVDFSNLLFLIQRVNNFIYTNIFDIFSFKREEENYKNLIDCLTWVAWDSNPELFG